MTATFYGQAFTPEQPDSPTDAYTVYVATIGAVSCRLRDYYYLGTDGKIVVSKWTAGVLVNDEQVVFALGETEQDAVDKAIEKLEGIRVALGALRK